ncbi:MAG: tetratricopeptide repeat protein, partial [Sphingomonadaceae bacterium]|nr:tetratricopeptide repeat protein [Sphingomonadaceae bacterium]
HGSDSELTIASPMPRQPDLPDDAPQRFQPLPLAQLSTFPDWNAVSRTMAPLYAPAAFAPGSPLAVEAARIRAASSDPLTRAELALESVQSNVRYLFNGLDHGNYVPQPPERTWAIRSGDCKAKTLLLLSLLKAVDVPAEPVLASTRLGDTVSVMLPAASAFDHILVRATIAGRDYWLDGTGLGARLADIGDTPNLRNVLPVRADGASLMAVATHADARPLIATTIDIDQSAGIGIPAPIRVAITMRGAFAEQIRAANGQMSAEQRKTVIDKVASNLDQFIGREKVGIQPIDRAIDVDPAAGTVTIRITGLIDGRWVWQDQRHALVLNPIVDSLAFDGERGRPEWAAIPVATAGVGSKTQSLTMHLPDHGAGFVVEGDRTLPPTLAGVGTKRTVSEAAGVITVGDRIDETAAEIAPRDVAATREALALAKSRQLKVLAPADYPAYWKVVRSARASGRFAAIEAMYATAIRDAIDKPPQIEKRAYFRAGVFDRTGAIADLTTIINARPTSAALSERAFLRYALRDDAGVLADGKAAYDLDPASGDGLGGYLLGLRAAGRTNDALALLDRLIAQGGERKVALLNTKANILTHAHQSAAALAAIEAAVAAKPGNADLLNARCWTKATLGVQLDTALKDCSKAIELGAPTAATLDSRAMVFLKMGRLDDALTDINAALAERPNQAASLFVRGVIETKLGNKAAAADDLAGARFISPRIDDEYRDYGVTAA